MLLPYSHLWELEKMYKTQNKVICLLLIPVQILIQRNANTFSVVPGLFVLLVSLMLRCVSGTQ